MITLADLLAPTRTVAALVHDTFCKVVEDDCLELSVIEIIDLLDLNDSTKVRTAIANILIEDAGEEFEFLTEEERNEVEMEMEAERRMDDDFFSTMSFLRSSHC